MPSTYPSSVPSTGCCAPESSTAIAVACHIPPHLRVARGDLVCVSRCCDSCLLHFEVLLARDCRNSCVPAPLRCGAHVESGDFCLLAALKWCSLASAEAVARVLLFGALCSQKSVTLVFSHLKWCSLASAETMARFAPLRRVRSRRVGVDFSQLATVPICWPPLPKQLLPAYLLHFVLSEISDCCFQPTFPSCLLASAETATRLHFFFAARAQQSMTCVRLCASNSTLRRRNGSASPSLHVNAHQSV